MNLMSQQNRLHCVKYFINDTEKRIFYNSLGFNCKPNTIIYSSQRAIIISSF